ncbi:hypothetical protein GQ53DRAFT_757076 [Thozetella sp. PMI_491]|nr:hypothetical protein GQ53DRAFT_757076 [Thozetella sp. PMI_491]
MGNDYNDDAESRPFLDREIFPPMPLGAKARRGLTQRALLWLWAVLTAVLIFSTVNLSFKLHVLSNGGIACVSQHGGLSSELGAARMAIGYHDIVFTSGIEEDENGTMFLNLPKDQPRYVGTPGPEVDAAWADLTKATEIWLDGDEAVPVANRTIHSEHGWLNLARKGLDWEYYYGDGPGQEPITAITKDHIYHCLEHLRQVSMCHGDLTPMRFQYTPHSAMPIWEEPHTCAALSPPPWIDQSDLSQ